MINLGYLIAFVSTQLRNKFALPRWKTRWCKFFKIITFSSACKECNAYSNKKIYL